MGPAKPTPELAKMLTLLSLPDDHPSAFCPGIVPDHLYLM
ncbi:MAG: hypothetical protein AVDCRST_MAG12-2111 [uncultured Rubrobacteraceae bacterium]|uniref:Uncharacterized protein n=1 Tax=uncultured Rubrobacteraceae bacterium TaxID=349277 RepID=A0A6J4S6Z7_9ACTN|nr:MAG: hypothetical protein AVDCRST_MAG12-2111 [uncultured Rubrobacteraceae bacterium]